VTSKPVVWDKSIVKTKNGFKVVLREDGETIEIKASTFEKAKSIVAFFPPEAFE
jgi:hypothetical protein